MLLSYTHFSRARLSTAVLHPFNQPPPTYVSQEFSNANTVNISLVLALDEAQSLITLLYLLKMDGSDSTYCRDSILRQMVWLLLVSQKKFLKCLNFELIYRQVWERVFSDSPLNGMLRVKKKSD